MVQAAQMVAIVLDRTGLQYHSTSLTTHSTLAMESPKPSASKDGNAGSGNVSNNHLGSTSDRVMLRKHLHLRRQRAANACTECHHRKVRCDVSRSGLPCTNCKTDSKVCTIKESRRGLRMRKLER